MTSTQSLVSRRGMMLATALLSLGLLVYLLAPILVPFAAAFVFAYISNPLVERLQGRHLSRTWAVSIVFLVLTLIMAAAVLGLIPALQKQLLAFAGSLPRYLDWLLVTGLPWLEANMGLDLSLLDAAAMKQTIIEHWRGVGNVLGKAVSGVTRSGVQVLGWLANLVLIPLVTFYLMRDWQGLLARLRSLVPPSARSTVTTFASEADAVLASFLRGQFSVMMALAAVYAVGLGLVGLDLALPLGLLAGLVSFVPYLGFIVGIGSAGLAALLQFQELSPVLWVLAVFGVGQLLESFVLTPYLVGDRLGLHPVTVIFAVMAGGQLFGFVGVLLALPAAAVLAVAVRHLQAAFAEDAASSGGSSET